MSRLFKTVSLAALLMATASAASAASATACNTILSAEGRASHVEGSADFIEYNRHVPDDLAKRRAISAWQGRVAELCPRYSAAWRRALKTRIDCDAGAGRVWCMASAQPGRKISSWFLPR